MKFLIFLFSLTFIGGATAAEGEGSLEWQRTRLQEVIEGKIRKVLAPIIPGDKLMVESAIELKEKKFRPSIRLTKPREDEATRGLFPLSKLGVWIDTEALQQIENSKLGESIFENIVRVQVFLVIDSAFADKKEEVRQAVEAALARLGKFNVTTEVDTVEFVREKHTYVDVLKEFKFPLGILFATLLMMLLGVWMSLRYQKLEQKKLAIMETQAQSAGGDSYDSVREGREESSADQEKQIHGGGVQDTGFKGVMQFKALLKGDPARASSLVKQWLSLQGSGPTEALVFLPKMISMDRMKVLFDKLEEDERKEWKSILGRPMSAGFEARGDAFILSQIVGNMLEPPIPVKQEIRDLLAGITPEESVQCAEKDPFLGAIFANTLSTAQVAKMFMLMSDEVASRILDESIKFTFDDVGKRFADIKTMLEELRREGHVEHNPLLEKTVDLIREVGPEKESTFFKALAKSGDEALLRSAAEKFFPADAIIELPKQILRVCLRKLSLTFRAELIVSLTDEVREGLLEALGTEGSKLRDLMESEILQIKEDRQRMKQIEKNKTAIWASFVQVCRQTLRDNPEMADDVQSVLQVWVTSQLENVGGERDHAA